MRLLVTRPEPDAAETAARLRALGHEPIIASMLTIVPMPPPADVAEPAAILFTSRNGVKALSLWPQMSGWLALPVFATGRATADAARLAGFVDVRPANGDAADLANYFMAHVDRNLRPILYPAARDRAGGLSSGLRANGFDVRTVETYKAEAATMLDRETLEAIRSGSIEGALFYSRRTAEAFRALIGREGLVESLRDLAIFALSGRVAEPLGDLGAPIFVARQPNEDAVFALLPQVER